MAKWKSPLFSDIRNKLGENVIFSTWKGRPYMRSYVVPSNPNTLLQQAHRAALTQAMAAGQTIFATGAHKTEWNAQALPELISGFNLYIKDFLGTPVLPDTYVVATATKISGENLTIPRGSVTVGVLRAGNIITYTPSAIGGTAPAYEILFANLAPAYTKTTGDTFYIMDNRVFHDSVTQSEMKAKSTSYLYPNETTGLAVPATIVT